MKRSERRLMARLIFKDTGEEVELEDNASIIEACEEVGIPFACTEGVCGTCVIRVIRGSENLNPITPAEDDFFGEGMAGNERLACQCRIQKNSVEITS